MYFIFGFFRGLSTSIECKYGNVRYYLKGEVDIPWSFNYRTKKAFTVICPIDINRPQYQSPVEKEAEKSFFCFLCTPGQISLKASTNRSGYCPGESIVIKADFENNTNRTVVPHAVLKQTQVFNAGGKVFKRNVKLTTITGVGIRGHKQANWDGQMLKIPPVPPSMSPQRLVGVEYNVCLGLYVPFVGLKSLVSLPIVIGTVPHRTGHRAVPMITAAPNENNSQTNSMDNDVHRSVTRKCHFFYLIYNKSN